MKKLIGRFPGILSLAIAVVAVVGVAIFAGSTSSSTTQADSRPEDDATAAFNMEIHSLVPGHKYQAGCDVLEIIVGLTTDHQENAVYPQNVHVYTIDPMNNIRYASDLTFNGPNEDWKIWRSSVITAGTDKPTETWQVIAIVGHKLLSWDPHALHAKMTVEVKNMPFMGHCG